MIEAPPVGTLVGFYTVLSEPVRRHNEKQVWCRCKCGKKGWVSVWAMAKKGLKGCYNCRVRKYPPPKVGERYGKLVVLEIFKKERGITWALCQCDCGNTREVYASLLSQNYTKMCVRCACPSVSAPLGVQLVNGNYIAKCPCCGKTRSITLPAAKKHGGPPPCGKCKKTMGTIKQVRVKCPACGFYRKTRQRVGDPVPLCRECKKKTK